MDPRTKPTVGVDASRAFVNQKTGTENYSYQLIKALVKSECQFRFRLYVRPPFSSSQFKVSNPDVEIVIIDRERYWTQIGLAGETWLNPPDLLFVPAHVVPFLKKPAVPVVVTVHDLRTEFLPQHESLLQRVYLSRYLEIVRARLAKQIIAVSESTRRDVIEKLGIDDKKVKVIYEGVDRERFHEGIKEERTKIKKVQEKYKIEGPYLLFVGTIQPRKNLVRLMEAFSRYLREKGDEQTKRMELVLAGGIGWNAEQIYATPTRLNIQQRVKFIGYVDDDDLPYLYAGAEIFVFPSLYEGFGLPVLEAMAVGTPVITSNVSSLPEVGGEAAYYVDPESVSSIMNGLSRVMTQSELRQKMIDRGYQQVKKFSWEQAARETCEVFQRALSSRS